MKTCGYGPFTPSTLTREALLAQALLAGKTRGCTKHLQLERFRASKAPLKAIGAYLSEVHAEATRRGCRFDRREILFPKKLRKKCLSAKGS